MLVSVVFNFAYDKEETPIYYFMWSWFAGLVIWFSTLCLIALVALTVMAADQGVSMRTVDIVQGSYGAGQKLNATGSGD